MREEKMKDLEWMSPQLLEKVSHSLSHSIANGGDASAEVISIRIEPSKLKELSKLKPWIAISQILFDWVSVIAMVALCEFFFSIPLFIFTVIWIASRQHSMLMLIHEGTHKRLFRSRSLNRWVADPLLAWPFFISHFGFEREHFAHHRQVGTMNDPEFLMKAKLKDYNFPCSRAQFFLRLASHLFGLRALREYYLMMFVGQYSRRLSLSANLGRLVFIGLLLGVLLKYADSGAIRIYLFYWIVPICTALVMMLYFRLVAEHFALPKGALLKTRNTAASWIESVFLSPVNIHYHLDHHLFPSVPYYNLPALHAELMKNEQYLAKAHLTKGYFAGLIRECTTPGET